MQHLTLEQKYEQFEEFFMIKHVVPVNMRLLEPSFTLPNAEELGEHMPFEFQIANELSEIDSKALRPLLSLGEHASQLAEYLNHQSKKIDLMMSLILQQHADQANSHQSIQFGGGGLVVESTKPWDLGANVEVKLFLREEAAAIFCFAEVIACKQVEDTYHISLIFSRIRDKDQDLLVRASLHLQAANLRKRKTQNMNQNENN
ncbi:PilZ domain-containing protein [Paraglaciecola sp. 2405UD69-4]|uniref:PilZ domain-containing protein n=1 Tax=Paraglaciecola sp. 2405UD69-4 TaxID=3391836 RepID=UPI0039C93B47